MINHIYKNFLENKEEYKKSEEYWEKLLDSILKGKNISYRKRLNYHSASDKTDFLDGNPIYDCYIEKDKKALRVIQEKPIHDKASIHAWMDASETEEGETFTELVLSLELSDSVSLIAQELIEHWLVQPISRSEMESYIDKKLFVIG